MPNLIRHGANALLHFFVRKVVGKLVAAPIRRRLALFEAATHRPREVQEALLHGILARQPDTAFGRDHHFDAIRTRSRTSAVRCPSPATTMSSRTWPASAAAN